MGFYFLKKRKFTLKVNTRDGKVERGHWWWEVSVGDGKEQRGKPTKATVK